MLRSKHLPIMLAAALGVVGCSVQSAVIRDQTVSYDDVIEDTTNQLLLLNILRAKDKAPLHFDTIPSIHESIQANASLQATLPFGPMNKSTNRDAATAGIGVQVAPSFEIDHLVTKDFATGIASPIDPKFVKYWLDRGLDRRIVLLLFFSSAEITGPDDQGRLHTIEVGNSPADAIDTLDEQQSLLRQKSGPSDALRCDSQSQFQHYLKLIDSLTTFSARYVTERRLLAEGLALDGKTPFKDLQTLAGLDPSKFQWVRTDGKQNLYSVYAVSSAPKTVLCFANTPVATGSEPASGSGACVSSVVEGNEDESTSTAQLPPVETPPPLSVPATTPSAYCQVLNRFVATFSSPKNAPDLGGTKSSLRLQIRSAGEMIQFLGDLVAYQEALRKRTPHPRELFRLNDPLTFGYCADEPAGERRSGCADIFFNLRHSTCDTRFAVKYRGSIWAVPNYSHRLDSRCDGGETEMDTSEPVKDHTIEVFAVVQQLVDLQQSATDILQTPYVQILP